MAISIPKLFCLVIPATIMLLLLSENTSGEQRAENPNADAQKAFETALQDRAPIGVFKTIIDSSLTLNVTESRPRPPLYLAAEAKRQDVVDLLIQSGADPNHRSKKGWTPLLIAVSFGSLDKDIAKTVRMLTKAGASAKFKPGDKVLACRMAVLAFCPDIVFRYLRRAGAEVDASDNTGRTALGELMTRGDTHVSRESLKFLRVSKADINHRDKTGWTPVMLAARTSGYQLLENMFGQPKNVRLQTPLKTPDINAKNQEGWTPLMIAIASTQRKHVYRWLKKELSIRQPTNPLLKENSHLIGTAVKRARSGRLQRIWTLLKNGADPTIQTKDGVCALTLLKEQDELESKAIQALINVVNSQE
jgi:ankyrin repeat protein